MYLDTYSKGIILYKLNFFFVKFHILCRQVDKLNIGNSFTKNIRVFSIILALINFFLENVKVIIIKYYNWQS